MSRDEIDDFLTRERVLRLATVDEQGWPAVVPLWFLWREAAFWVWNLTRAERTRRLHDGRTQAALVVDAGREYEQLQGVECRVDYSHVADDEVPEQIWADFGRKYFGPDVVLEPADHHQWFRFVPLGINSWDFRKM